MQKKTVDAFDHYRETYSATVNSAVSFTGLDVDFFTRVKADYISDLAVATFKSTDKLNVLDIGCGVGNFHSLVGPKFGSLHGVDVSPASIEKAQATHPNVSYRSYEGHRLPYDDHSFDLTFTICVMHHVPPRDRSGFVSEMLRVLRPGGLALVFEHNPKNPLTMRAVNNCPFDEDAVLLPSAETIDLLRAAGFASVQSRFILTLPAANSALRAVDRLFSLIPLGAQYYVSARRP
ncbi:MAG: hypothetical protein JWL62_3750 [Hyphomicrobiales bacterium]|nr:hypothetical protein [Hyphomicrobiales bacterium]